MKKVILVLALLLIATPAFATVTITATPTPGTGNVVISYSSDEPNSIRGLALDVVVTQVGSSQGAPYITAVSNYLTGETTNESNRGFGIFPSTITIDSSGNVTNSGNPVSPKGKYSSDTRDGLDSNGVTIEMAALYDMDNAALAPAASGTLCTITVNHDCDLSITTNNIRGGIVLNNGKYSQDPCSPNALQVDLTSATGVSVRFEVTSHTISGTVGLDGATMNGLPGSPTTSGGGAYSATVDNNWSGTVTPQKAGYGFTPASKIYSDVASDQTSENYTAYVLTYTISGTVGIDGVSMGGLPGAPVTSGGGLYTATVGYGWAGTATPSKTGYTFSPAGATYTSVTSNQTQNYTAMPLTYTISGTVGIDGVSMGGLPGAPVTSGGGLYTATVGYGWAGTATPSKTGYTFSPANKTYSSITSSQTAQNYTATQLTFTISGMVSKNTLSGVTMTGLPGSPVTASGAYTATVVYGWSGIATPTKSGFQFVPTNKTYSNVTANQTAQDYRLGNYGDISNGTGTGADNYVRSEDVVAIQSLLSNHGTPISKKLTILSTSPYFDQRADADGDGKIMSGDIVAVQGWLSNHGTPISKKLTVVCPHSYGPTM